MNINQGMEKKLKFFYGNNKILCYWFSFATLWYLKYKKMIHKIHIMFVKKHLIYIHLHHSIPCFVHPQHSSTICWKIMKQNSLLSMLRMLGVRKGGKLTCLIRYFGDFRTKVFSIFFYVLGFQWLFFCLKTSSSRNSQKEWKIHLE